MKRAMVDNPYACCASILTVLLLTGTAHAQREWTFHDVRIVDETVAPDHEFLYGYIDHVFTITNTSTARTRRVQLTAPPVEFGCNVPCINRLSRAVELAPGTTTRVSILQPPIALSEPGFTVTIDGRPQRNTVDASAARTFRVGSGAHDLTARGTAWPVSVPYRDEVYILASPDAMDVPSVRDIHARREFNFTRHHSPPSAWRRNWVSYSGFAAVVITAAEWQTAPADLRSTLLHFVSAGGVLCLLGDIDIASLADQTPTSFDRGESAYHGFGLLMRIDADRLDYALDDSPWNDLIEAAYETHRVLANEQPPEEANRLFPVADAATVPTTGLFVLLVLFTLIAGPLNLLVLTRGRRRIWLLWTTPTIALVFCGSVFAYMLYGEGLTPTVRVGTVTLLNQETREATTLGWLGYYAPLTPDDGLRFDDRTELTPQLAQSWQDWPRTVLHVSHEQHLASGWVTARVPSHFRVRRVATDRRRLQIERDEAGAPVVVNRLDTDIDELYVFDTDGSLYRTRLLADGERATAEPAELEDWYGEHSGDRRRQIFQTNWNAEPPFDLDYLAATLRTAGYVAIIDHSPFIDPSLETYHTREHQSVVIGHLGTADLTVPPAYSPEGRP